MRIATTLFLWGILVAPAWGATITFDTPSDDRWHYPFNFTPGARVTGSIFGAVGVPEFNNRDGVVIVAWDTSDQITPGLGSENYDIDSLTVTMTVQANDNIQPEWPIDLTVDEWFTYDLNGDGDINADGIPRGEPGDVDGESDDPDPGRAIELFGAGFGPTHDAQTWTETSSYVGGTDMVAMPRDPFPFVYQDGTLAMLHVEDNVSGLYNEDEGVFSFTPTPWAIGVPSGYTPGSQTVPFEVTFDIDLSLSDGAVRAYYQNQLNEGRLFVVITSLRETPVQGPQAGVPSFYMKEGVVLKEGAAAPRLTVDLGGDDIPAVSDWGVAIMVLLLLSAGTLVLRNNRLTGAVRSAGNMA